MLPATTILETCDLLVQQWKKHSEHPTSNNNASAGSVYMTSHCIHATAITQRVGVTEHDRPLNFTSLESLTVIAFTLFCHVPSHAA